LLSSFHGALVIASIVVGLELMAISYIRYHFFQMKFWRSIAMVMLGGGIVFAAGILIGAA
jgi:erythrin-vacuolar iron transport family protein